MPVQIKVSTDVLLKQLQEYKLQVQRKLTGMVELFSYNITLEAINNTPYGSFVNKDTGEINSLYFIPARSSEYHLQPEPGHAKGGWILSFGSSSKYKLGVIANSENADNVKVSAENSAKDYKLGETVYITNNIPYVANSGIVMPNFGSLENGYSLQAPSGISGPTINSIMNVYAQNLKEYYDMSAK